MSRVLVLLTVALAVAVVPASGMVYAHTIEYPTSISIARTPKAAVLPKGTEVTFYGKVSSEKHACVVNSRVLLKVVVGGIGELKEAVTWTNATGHYSFTRTVRQTHKWQVQFDGKVLNKATPHNHTCGAVWSRVIRVPVR